MLVRFNDLPLVVRERFVRVANQRPHDPSIVIAFQPRTGPGWLNYVGVIVGGIASAAWLGLLAETGARYEPAPSGYVAFAIPLAVFFTSLIGVAYRFIWKRPPYPEGAYAFPGMLVSANAGYLRIVPTSSAGEPQVTHFHVRSQYRRSWLRFGGLEYGFATKQAAAYVATAVVRARQIYAAAWQRGDAATIQQIDPFHECTMTNNWKGREEERRLPPHADIVPPSANNGRWLAALVLAAMVSSIAYAAIDSLYAHNRRPVTKQTQPKKAAAAAADDE